MTLPHLWEIDHPYYCNEGNYFAHGDEQPHCEYGSWENFYDEEGDCDYDMNLLFRWDWRKAVPDEKLWCNPTDVLLLYWLGQRKGLYRWTTVQVCDADEPAVRVWLTDRWQYLRLLWHGISDPHNDRDTTTWTPPLS